MASLLLYEDRPAYGLVLKIIIVLVPGLLLFASFYFWSSGNGDAALALLVEGIIISAIFWSIFPRSYRIYEDHIRIVLGGSFSFKAGFNNIKSLRVSTRLSFGVNFATTISRSYVEITRANGMRIAITPKAPDSFVENFNRAFSEWKRTRGNVAAEIKGSL